MTDFFTTDLWQACLYMALAYGFISGFVKKISAENRKRRTTP